MDKLNHNKTIFICWLAYACAYLGRLNFSASLVAVISDFGVSKSAAGLVSSCFFFAYGAGQLINGILSKYYSSKRMIFLSLVSSSVLNIAIIFCPSVESMKYVWMLNGLMQSVLWSTLIKTISENLPDERIPSAVFAMSTTVPVGTFIIYGVSALFVRLNMWRGSFVFASVAMIASAVVWLLLYPDTDEKKVSQVRKKPQKIKMSAAMMFALAVTAFSGIANGFIKDGINTWVPSLLYEEFDVSQASSILLTLLLPLVSTLGAGIAKTVHKRIASHGIMNMIFFIISAAFCSGILITMKERKLFLMMILFIVVSCSMAVINNVITSMFALDNRKMLNAGFAAGFLNTFCYIGSTITSYGLGAVSQKSGWNTVFIIMIAVSSAAILMSLIGAISEKKVMIRVSETQADLRR